jgi:hypothetical protein
MMELGLDCVDAVILRWIVDFRDTGKMKRMLIDEGEFFWINYGTLIESVPITGITNKEVLARRMGKMCDCGLMLKHVEKSAQGTYTYFRFNAEVLESMLQPTQKSTPTRPESRPPTRLESTPIDSSIRDNSSNTDTNVSKKRYGEFKNVHLTDDEHSKLAERMGADRLESGINILDAYIEQKGKRYKSHFAVMKEGGWVWERVHKDKPRATTNDEYANGMFNHERNR